VAPDSADISQFPLNARKANEARIVKTAILVSFILTAVFIEPPLSVDSAIGCRKSNVPSDSQVVDGLLEVHVRIERLSPIY
jgi:hypothetical protein